jgi:hypothetical protein
VTGRLEHFGQTGDPRAWVRIANGLLDRIASGELQPHDLAPLVDDLRIDAGLAITPISRARAALDPRCPPGQYACALAGLAAASGLAFRRDPYRPASRADRPGRRHVPGPGHADADPPDRGQRRRALPAHLTSPFETSS